VPQNKHILKSLKIKVSKMYYQEKLTKTNIADKLGISRFRVARLIDQAVHEGIVQIIVNEPISLSHSLERDIEDLFALKKVLVVQAHEVSEQKLKQQLGIAASELLMEIIHDGQVFGIALGTTIEQTVKALPPKLNKKVEVVQITGSFTGLLPESSSHELARDVAKIFNSKCHLLYLPAIFDNPETCRAVKQDSSVKETLKMFDKIDITVVGIGAFYPEPTSTLYRAGYLTKEDLQKLKNKQATGDIFSHFFDINGRFCDAEFAERVITINPEQIKKIKYRIGVAGGNHKAYAILGAIKGRWINMLVTDEDVAKTVLKLEKDERRGKLSL